MLAKPNIYIKFLYKDNCYVIYKNNVVIDDNSGKGYRSELSASKQLNKILQRENFQYKKYLHELNTLIDEWFAYNQKFYNICQNTEYEYSLNNKIFDLNVFNQLLSEHETSPLPVAAKYLFYVFKHGSFSIEKKKKVKKKHRSANYYFNRFVYNFNKNAKKVDRLKI